MKHNRPAQQEKDKKVNKPDMGNKLNLLPNIVYVFRVIGMGLGGLAVSFVLSENAAPFSSWFWLVFSCYIWPHLAFFWAKNQDSPFQAEQTNLLVDSFIAGTSVALMHYNLLPSVLLISIATADKVNSGIPKLWLKSIPLTVLGALLFSLFTGFAFQPNTSMTVIIACLPVAVIHTLLVSTYSYNLINKLQYQNKKLNHLSQVDSLTGVSNRRHWQEKSHQILKQHQDVQIEASLMLVDIDHFKQVNDQYGHVIGDDVLIELAALLKKTAGNQAIIGRLGGDEFAATIKLPVQEAKILAQKLTAAVESLNFPQAEKLKLSTSIGIADISTAIRRAQKMVRCRR
ncbi:diguanylate cyclase [Marinicella rhabdoformis]|uniref:diguanylate cyclase n=1 Tax=Marinicella rhabdoformis TaxID=2580566 RepID=UPI0012AEC6DC|nr:diguanylate cyclase [Marinicella rhabdoformis]